MKPSIAAPKIQVQSKGYNTTPSKVRSDTENSVKSESKKDKDKENEKDVGKSEALRTERNKRLKLEKVLYQQQKTMKQLQSKIQDVRDEKLFEASIKYDQTIPSHDHAKVIRTDFDNLTTNKLTLLSIKEIFPDAKDIIVTTLKCQAQAGDSKLEVNSTDGFVKGMVILFGAGSTMEYSRLTGFGSLKIEPKLTYNHLAGTMVFGIRSKAPDISQSIEKCIITFFVKDSVLESIIENAVYNSIERKKVREENKMRRVYCRKRTSTISYSPINLSGKFLNTVASVNPNMFFSVGDGITCFGKMPHVIDVMAIFNSCDQDDDGNFEKCSFNKFVQLCELDPLVELIGSKYRSLNDNKGGDQKYFSWKDYVISVRGFCFSSNHPPSGDQKFQYQLFDMLVNENGVVSKSSIFELTKYCMLPESFELLSEYLSLDEFKVTINNLLSVGLGDHYLIRLSKYKSQLLRRMKSVDQSEEFMTTETTTKFASTIKQLVLNQAINSIVALTETGVCHILDMGSSKIIHTSRVMYSEPIRENYFEGEKEFLSWLKSLDDLRYRAVEEYSSKQCKKYWECYPNNNLIVVDPTSGTIAVNCDFLNQSICFHEPISLRRLFRLKLPYGVGAEMKDFVKDSLDNTSNLASKRVCGVLLNFSFCMKTSLVFCKYSNKDGLCIIDMWSGSVLRELGGHCGGIRSFAFDENSLMALTGGEDGIVRVWNLKGSISKRSKASLVGDSKKESKLLQISHKILLHYVSEAKYYRICAQLNVHATWQRGTFIRYVDSSFHAIRHPERKQDIYAEIVAENGTVNYFSKSELYRAGGNNANGTKKFTSSFKSGQQLEYFAPRFENFLEEICLVLRCNPADHIHEEVFMKTLRQIYEGVKIVGGLEDLENIVKNYGSVATLREYCELVQNPTALLDTPVAVIFGGSLPISFLSFDSTKNLIVGINAIGEVLVWSMDRNCGSLHFCYKACKIENPLSSNVNFSIAAPLLRPNPADSWVLNNLDAIQMASINSAGKKELCACGYVYLLDDDNFYSIETAGFSIELACLHGKSLDLLLSYLSSKGAIEKLTQSHRLKNNIRKVLFVVFKQEGMFQELIENVLNSNVQNSEIGYETSMFAVVAFKRSIKAAYEVTTKRSIGFLRSTSNSCNKIEEFGSRGTTVVSDKDISRISTTNRSRKEKSDSRLTLNNGQIVEYSKSRDIQSNSESNCYNMIIADGDHIHVTSINISAIEKQIARKIVNCCSLRKSFDCYSSVRSMKRIVGVESGRDYIKTVLPSLIKHGEVHNSISSHDSMRKLYFEKMCQRSFYVYVALLSVIFDWRNVLASHPMLRWIISCLTAINPHFNQQMATSEIVHTVAKCVHVAFNGKLTIEELVVLHEKRNCYRNMASDILSYQDLGFGYTANDFAMKFDKTLFVDHVGLIPRITMSNGPTARSLLLDLINHLQKVQIASQDKLSTVSAFLERDEVLSYCASIFSHQIPSSSPLLETFDDLSFAERETEMKCYSILDSKLIASMLPGVEFREIVCVEAGKENDGSRSFLIWSCNDQAKEFITKELNTLKALMNELNHPCILKPLSNVTFLGVAVVPNAVFDMDELWMKLSDVSESFFRGKVHLVIKIVEQIISVIRMAESKEIDLSCLSLENIYFCSTTAEIKILPLPTLHKTSDTKNLNMLEIYCQFSSSFPVVKEAIPVNEKSCKGSIGAWDRWSLASIAYRLIFGKKHIVQKSILPNNITTELNSIFGSLLSDNLQQGDVESYLWKSLDFASIKRILLSRKIFVQRMRSINIPTKEASSIFDSICRNFVFSVSGNHKTAEWSTKEIQIVMEKFFAYQDNFSEIHNFVQSILLLPTFEPDDKARCMVLLVENFQDILPTLIQYAAVQYLLLVLTPLVDPNFSIYGQRVQSLITSKLINSFNWYIETQNNHFLKPIPTFALEKINFSQWSSFRSVESSVSNFTISKNSLMISVKKDMQKLFNVMHDVEHALRPLCVFVKMQHAELSEFESTGKVNDQASSLLQSLLQLEQYLMCNLLKKSIYFRSLIDHIQRSAFIGRREDKRGSTTLCNQLSTFVSILQQVPNMSLNPSQFSKIDDFKLTITATFKSFLEQVVESLLVIELGLYCANPLIESILWGKARAIKIQTSTKWTFDTHQGVDSILSTVFGEDGNGNRKYYLSKELLRPDGETSQTRFSKIFFSNYMRVSRSVSSYFGARRTSNASRATLSLLNVFSMMLTGRSNAANPLIMSEAVAKVQIVVDFYDKIPIYSFMVAMDHNIRKAALKVFLSAFALLACMQEQDGMKFQAVQKLGVIFSTFQWMRAITKLIRNRNSNNESVLEIMNTLQFMAERKDWIRHWKDCGLISALKFASRMDKREEFEIAKCAQTITQKILKNLQPIVLAPKIQEILAVTKDLSNGGTVEEHQELINRLHTHIYSILSQSDLEYIQCIAQYLTSSVSRILLQLATLDMLQEKSDKLVRLALHCVSTIEAILALTKQKFINSYPPLLHMILSNFKSEKDPHDSYSKSGLIDNLQYIGSNIVKANLYSYMMVQSKIVDIAVSLINDEVATEIIVKNQQHHFLCQYLKCSWRPLKQILQSHAWMQSTSSLISIIENNYRLGTALFCSNNADMIGKVIESKVIEELAKEWIFDTTSTSNAYVEKSLGYCPLLAQIARILKYALDNLKQEHPLLEEILYHFVEQKIILHFRESIFEARYSSKLKSFLALSYQSLLQALVKRCEDIYSDKLQVM